MVDGTNGSLAGRRALVTGSGHGIGAGIATALAAAGADVVVHYGQSADKAEQTRQQVAGHGVRSTILQADVTRTVEVDRLIADSVDFLGGLDILVCNAGHLVGREAVATMTDDHYASVMEVNIGATFRTVRAALPHLEKSDHGRIVTMSSLAAQNGGGNGSTIYAAAKSAVLGFTKGLAKEIAGSGTTVNALAPGFIGDTPFHDRFSPPEAQQTMIAGIPLGRAGQVSEVASAVTWLCSDGAAFVTGTTVDITGGAWFH
ncbi:SDR family NAD(P)-dependent oxidoreductase [Microlunatus soli]|uniref:3-oxoacyl-[acyl-carrier protein] reductase n=1 Tax=Microlunatus soli TaxID=630515 RepID=A0A1H1TW96_9ACTN|nr:SDR family NAD(P)-dependent oxidoreductase [Microlunatus soli]SDS64517.1 3-oxoacyl-[acyl-carrier protein] reductase [Microlunatus soli]